MKLAFHGTSFQKARLIKKEGFTNTQKNWSASETGKTYFFHDPANNEQALQYAFTQAGNPAYYEQIAKPAIIVIDITNKVIRHDSTDTMPKTVAKYAYETKDIILPEDIVAIYSIKGTLNVLKPLAHSAMRDKKYLTHTTEHYSVSKYDKKLTILYTPLRKIYSNSKRFNDAPNFSGKMVHI